jgi:integrase
MPTSSAQQLRVFLDHVADDDQEALWRLAATTGMRRGELAGLQWSDVDLQAGRVTIVRQRAKGGQTVESGPTKT